MEKDTTFEKKYQQYSAFLAKQQRLLPVAKEIKSKPNIINVVQDKRALVQAYGHITMIDVIKMTDKKSMKAWAVELGSEAVEAVLAVLLERTYKCFGQVVRDVDLMDLAIDVLHSEYYYLSIEDLFVCLKDLEQSEVSFKVTPARIFRALSAYAAKRLDVAEELNYMAHISNKPRALDRVDMEKDFKETQRAAVRQHNFNETLKAEQEKLKKNK